MNAFEIMLDATKRLSAKTADNLSSNLLVGTYSNGSVVLEDGYSVSGELLSYSQLCSDCVIEIPSQDNPTHDHEFKEDLGSYIGICPSGQVMFLDTKAAEGIDLNMNPETLFDQISQLSPEASVLNLSHSHNFKPDLKKIRVWRGLVDGDSVLVLKVNPRCFVVLCKLGKITNENNEGSLGHESID